MAQILDPLPNGQKGTILCCYVNATSHIQIVRITNIASWYFERVVFPGQRLVFEAVPQGQLEIHSGMMASSILSDTIPCEQLSINEGFDEEEEDEDWSQKAMKTNKLTVLPPVSVVLPSLKIPAIAYSSPSILEPSFA